MNKLLEIHEPIFGNPWAIFSLVVTTFSRVIIFLYGEIVNPIFHITMMIFDNVLQIGSCYGL